MPLAYFVAVGCIVHTYIDKCYRRIHPQLLFQPILKCYVVCVNDPYFSLLLLSPAQVLKVSYIYSFIYFYAYFTK